MTRSSLRKDKLLWEGFTLLQEEEGFRFSFDAVLLACFFRTAPQERVLDAACGNGVLPLLLLAKEPTLKIVGLELDKDTAALARKNMWNNRVSVEIFHSDTMKSDALFPQGSFDGIIVNPPYYHRNTVRLPKNPKIAMAKTEQYWDTATFFQKAFWLLPEKGTLTAAYPKERQDEIETAAKAWGFKVSRRLFLSSLPQKPPYLVLFEFKKNGACTETIESQLTVYDTEGCFSPLTQKILKEKSCAL